MDALCADTGICWLTALFERSEEDVSAMKYLFLLEWGNAPLLSIEGAFSTSS